MTIHPPPPISYEDRDQKTTTPKHLKQLNPNNLSTITQPSSTTNLKSIILIFSSLIITCSWYLHHRSNSLLPLDHHPLHPNIIPTIPQPHQSSHSHPSTYPQQHQQHQHQPPPPPSSRFPTPVPPSESHARSAIKRAIKDSWSAYALSPAWGSDDFHPISLTGGNLTQSGSIGFFIVDVLDTILLTGDMHDQYQRARTYVERDLHFDVDGDLNAFETTIRVLGGLLSVYHLSGHDSLYLRKAIDLGTRLLPIFDSPTGIPYSFINLKTGVAKADRDNAGLSSLAEATTLQLEFKYLAELSGEKVFWDVAERAMRPFKNAPSFKGLLPILVSPTTGHFAFDIRLGSRGDSYYEYLLKQYLQTNRTQVVYKEMYDRAMTGVKEELARETPEGAVYVGELVRQGSSYVFASKQDHLVCFLGGTLMLGVTEGRGALTEDEVEEMPDQAQEDWSFGKELIRTCVDTYQKSATGLGPEIVSFKKVPEQSERHYQREWSIPKYNRDFPSLDARNILRPETVESLFFAWRSTKDPIYRQWGWEIFKAFEEHCKLPSNGAFVSIKDVDRVPAQKENRMETFWLAETLKYLLLLFSDDSLIPLDSFVFNTEAHIFPIFTPSPYLVGDGNDEE